MRETITLTVEGRVRGDLIAAARREIKLLLGTVGYELTDAHYTPRAWTSSTDDPTPRVVLWEAEVTAELKS